MRRPIYNYSRQVKDKPKKYSLSLFMRNGDETEHIVFEYYKIRTKMVDKMNYGTYGGINHTYYYYVYFDDKEVSICESDYDRINKIIYENNNGR